MPDPADNTPQVVSEPKVWALIIEEYESNSDDDSVSNVQENIEKPSFAFTDTVKHDDLHKALKDKGVVDSGCSSHMTGNKAHLADYQEFKGYVEELKHYNLFSVSQMCEKKNNVLFTDIDCLVLSPDFKLPDENQPQNKTPYELLTGRQPIISYLRPFGFHVTILNTIDQLGKFDGKSNSGFLVGYSLNSKAFRVYNLETKRVEENLHVNFLENKLNVTGKGHAWMFDLDYLTNFMFYEPVSLENLANKCAGPQEANNSAGTQANEDEGANLEEIDLHDEHFILPIWSAYSTTVKSSEDKIEKNEKPVSQVEKIFQEELEKLKRQENEANDAVRKEATHDTQDANTNITNLLNAVNVPVSTVGPSRALNDDEPSYPGDPSMPHLEDIFISPSEGIFTNSSYDNEGVVIDFNNLETIVNVSPTPTNRIHTIHPKTQILGDLMSAVQTRSKVKKNSEAHALFSYIQNQQRNNHKDFQHCLFACFLSQFQIQKIWVLVDLPFGKKAIRTKWVYRNKKDERGVIVRNKARLVTQRHRQEEGIDYDVVFAHVARIEAIRIFLAFASYMGFIVYQMDVKSAFLYDTIDEEVYVTQPPSFVDPKFPNKVYKVVKVLYGLHQAPRACKKKKDIMLVQVYVNDIIFGSRKKSWCDDFELLMKNRFQMSSIGELTFFLGLQLDDEEGISCLANDDIFTGLANMGYEKMSDKLTFYKAFLSPRGGNEISRCMHSSLLCSTSPWNSQNLLLFLFSTGVDIGGGALNLPLPKAKIPFGDFVRSVNLLRLRSDLC
nr:hypothetical protein [Tanacetum cinerariifolium]